MSPSLIDCAASALRSKVMSFAWLFACSMDLMASSACGAPRVTIQSIDGSCESFACSVDVTAAGAPPGTRGF
jgi:hypothetical protein